VPYDDLDRPPALPVREEPSMDTFIVRMAAVCGGAMVALVLLSMAFPTVGPALALLGGLGAGVVVLRGHVPTSVQGLLTVGGFLLSGLVLIPS
jgi:hypothetical protein